MLATLTGIITRELLTAFEKAGVRETHLAFIVPAHGKFMREWFWGAWKIRDKAWATARRAQ